jgi:hypothetical protein
LRVPAPAQAHQAVDMVLGDIFDGDLRHIAQFAAHQHFMGLIPAAAEDGPALGQDAADVLAFQGHHAVFDQAAKAVHDPEDRHPVVQG